MTPPDLTKARIYYPDGRVEHYNSAYAAFILWCNLPAGTTAAYRAPSDPRPVTQDDYVNVSAE